MKYILTLLIPLFVLNKYQQIHELELGKYLPSDVKIIDSSKYRFRVTSGGRSEDVITIMYKTIEYDVAFDGNKKIKYLFTNDMDFQTKEGISTRNNYKKIKRFEKGLKIFEPDFGYLVRLPSGWIALFADQKVLSAGKVNDSSKISAFIKKQLPF